jgi:hypothetical protein
VPLVLFLDEVYRKFKELPMNKTIYHPGASSEIDMIEKQNAALMAAGWTITFDWTASVRKAGGGSPDDKDVRRSAALADLEGILAADVVWVSQPDERSTSTGVWIELGYALAKREYKNGAFGPKIIVSGPSRKCIFSDLADYRFETHEEALRFIVHELAP